MANIVYLPGLLGSDLGYARPDPYPPQNVWCDLGALLVGGAALLQLAEDGLSPGPLAEGVTIIPTSIFAPLYAPLGLYLLSKGHNLLVYPYDWRQSVIASGRALADAARLAFARQPFSIVAHSQGGLVARACWQWLAEAGADSLITRIVTLCSPHFGASEVIRVYGRLPTLYQGIVRVTGWIPGLRGNPGPAYMDDVIASWIGMAELLPFRAAGPLPTRAPALAALPWSVGYYSGGNPFLAQTQLDAALTSQEWLLTATAPGKMTCVIAVGEETVDLPTGADPTGNAGYTYSQNGDGLVMADAATLPGAATVTISGSHAGVLLTPAVWSLVAGLVAG